MSGARAGMAEIAEGVKWLLEGTARKRPRLEFKKIFFKSCSIPLPKLNELKCSLILLLGSLCCSQGAKYSREPAPTS